MNICLDSFCFIPNSSVLFKIQVGDLERPAPSRVQTAPRHSNRTHECRSQTGPIFRKITWAPVREPLLTWTPSLHVGLEPLLYVDLRDVGVYVQEGTVRSPPELAHYPECSATSTSLSRENCASVCVYNIYICISDVYK